MIYLKKYVKFRKELDYVLICDCSKIQNYELPLETYELFVSLKKGYKTKKPIGIVMEKDIIDDLNNLGLLDKKPNSNDGFHEKKWIKLTYDEKEFF
jgi:hypothetical protein